MFVSSMFSVSAQRPNWWTLACSGPASQQHKPVWLFHAMTVYYLFHSFFLCLFISLCVIMWKCRASDSDCSLHLCWKWAVTLTNSYRYSQNDRHGIKVTRNKTWQGGFIVHHASSEQSFQSSVVFCNQKRSWQLSSPTWLGDQWALLPSNISILNSTTL